MKGSAALHSALTFVSLEDIFSSNFEKFFNYRNIQIAKVVKARSFEKIAIINDLYVTKRVRIQIGEKEESCERKKNL